MSDSHDLNLVIPRQFRESPLFHRSLMENIRYGWTNASDEEVIEAAIKAHAHEFISALPQGYDSLLCTRQFFNGVVTH